MGATFLDTALDCIARGWHVFPCKPRTKEPAITGGFHSASRDPEQARAWWAKWPDANVGIATGESGLTVLDCDHGFACLSDFRAWANERLPATYTVRTGRRDSYGVQLYYSGPQRQSIGWQQDGCSGDIRSETGYVMAAGSIHDKTGELYEVILDVPIAPAPPYVYALKSAAKEKVTDDGGPIEHHRNVTLTSISGKLRNAGLSASALEVALLQVNADRCVPPLEEDEVKQIAKHAAKWKLPELEPIAVVGGAKAAEGSVDWRARYHTSDEMSNAPEPTFIIEGFLQKDVITAIAAPVGQRKTIIAANVVHASITGEPLFGHFTVTHHPARVLYLCPEMGLYAFAKRIRDLGLMEHVGENLFCRTMNSEGKLALKDLTREELTGALVVVDTAVRFVEGDENSSEDMKVFAEDCFRLIRDGAASLLVLFHSPKATKDVSELTLENAMRGSGDLGAFVSSCWATRLQNPDADWEALISYLKNVKQRDFESKPFEVRSDKRGKLHIVTKPGEPVKLNGKSAGPRGDADGREAEAIQVIRDNPGLSQAKIVRKLKDLGITRSKTWVGDKRFDVLNVGAKLTTAL